jgi:hypothetical protein
MSTPHTRTLPDREIRQAEERLEEQKTLVRRSIMHGNPSQAAEDKLHQLEWALLRAKEQRLNKRSSEIRRKMRDRRSR